MMGPITSIRRADIPSGGLQLEALWDAALLEQLPEGICRPDIEAPLRLDLSLSVDGTRVMLVGMCHAQVRSTCVRCLKRFFYPLSISFRYVFQPAGLEDLPGNVRLGPGDSDVAFYDGECIDLVAPVFEQIHLGLPDYPRCSPDCRGLCAQCGANLNNSACACAAALRRQSPFAVLGKLKKKA